MVGDDLISYQCFSCFAEVHFHPCPTCGFIQTVSGRWSVYTCGRCGAKVDAPRRWSYGTSARAKQAEGVAFTYPKL